MSVLVLSESENEGEELLEDLEEVVVVESPRADERANVPVSVVTERFLRAIVDKVPLDRIEELHLFAALRQGTIETGIAVVAARVIVVEEVAPLLPLELQLEAVGSGTSGISSVDEEVPDENVAGEDVADESVADENVVEDEVTGPALSNAGADVDASQLSNTPTHSDNVTSEGPDQEAIENAEMVADEQAADTDNADDSPYADEPVQLKLVPTTDFSLSESKPLTMPESPREVAATEVREPRIRHTVYTARYRLIVKGPERGRWEMDVVDEADAPLLAVETVVRGVQRRAGEETATVRYDAAQLARLLRLPYPG